MKAKIVLVGAAHVGKTAITTRSVSDGLNPSLKAMTQGSAHPKKVHVAGVERELEIWDIAGQEQYHALGPLYYRNAQAGIVVFDVTGKRSFDDCRQ